MNDAQRKAVTAAIKDGLADIRRHALALRHTTCGYSHPNPFQPGTVTSTGRDGHLARKRPLSSPEEWPCDCKFMKCDDPTVGGEQTGCCEAHSILHIVRDIDQLLGE